MYSSKAKLPEQPKVSQPWTLIYPGSLSSSLLSLSFFKFYLLELHCCQDKALSLSLIGGGWVYIQPFTTYVSYVGHIIEVASY